MGERHRLLGGYRGGSDMRLGTLVKHIEWEYIGVVIETSVILKDTCLVRWIGDSVNDFADADCLVVLCE